MTMVQSLVHTIGIEPARMRVLDTIRHKRNVVDYSGVDVEPSDACEAVVAAKTLPADVKAGLAKHHPDCDEHHAARCQLQRHPDEQPREQPLVHQRRGVVRPDPHHRRYISEGLRRDEATYTSDAVERLARALKKRGVSGKVLDEAMRDVAA